MARSNLDVTLLPVEELELKNRQGIMVTNLNSAGEDKTALSGLR